MSSAMQFLLSGLVNGAVFGLAALAIVLVYRVSGVVNLAQGEMITLGALLSLWVQVQFGVPLLVAGAVAVVAVALLSMSFVDLAIRPAQRRGTSRMDIIFVTLALSVMCQGLAYLIGGATAQSAPAFIDRPPLKVFGATLPWQNFIVISLTVVIAIALALLFSRTMIGKAMTASAENARGAESLGLSVQSMGRISFAVAGGIGALCGLVLLPIVSFSYLTGFNFGMQGLAAAAMVGLRSPLAALGGGVAIGVLGSFATGYLSASYQVVFVSVVLAVALLRWPQLLGRHAS